MPSLTFVVTPASASSYPRSSTTSMSTTIQPVLSDKSIDDHLKYLSHLIGNVATWRQPYHFVLGNEAADLDSIASAIVFSFSCRHESNIFPVINIPRRHLHLRRDVLLALTLANVNQQSLLFIDDPIVQKSLSPPYNNGKSLAISLVDHNSLAPHQTQLSDFVIAVIDHHEDDHMFESANPRIIDRVGSCASLIAEFELKRNSQNLSNITPAAAVLLLCAILLDCHNMDKAVGKGTVRDNSAIEKLMVDAQFTTQIQRDDLFNKLITARADISNMTAVDLLRKDVKIVNVSKINVAICSVGVQPADLVKRAGDQGLQNDVHELSKMWMVDAVIVMLAFQTDNAMFTRKILISRGGVGNYIAKQLRDTEDDVLQLEDGYVRDGNNVEFSQFHYLSQRNAKASRKVVLPVVKSILSSFHP